MNNIVSAEELMSLQEGKEFIANYCNFKDYEADDKDINENFNYFLVALCTLVKSKRNSIDYYVSSICDVKGSKYVKVKYKIGKSEQKMKIPINRVGYDKFIRNLSEFINISVLGSEAVDYLNDKIEDIQSNTKSSLAFSYMISMMDENTDIYEWDYDKIKIRLSKKATIQLINKYRDGELDDCIEKTDWSLKLCDFVERFNSLQLHEAMNITLESSDIEKELIRNMVSSNDVKLVIDKIEKDAVTNIKTVSLINELGKFIVICNWKVDRGKVSLDIMDNKVLDIENNRFVCSRDIVDRLRDKILKQYKI